eukprot:3217857-Pyramimonas_sp.AAC.1
MATKPGKTGLLLRTLTRTGTSKAGWKLVGQKTQTTAKKAVCGVAVQATGSTGARTRREVQARALTGVRQAKRL